MILTLYEPFRHWSETGSVYILSDPHFGDSDCKLMDSGWIEPEEQVTRINALVMKSDTFVCLGDVGDASFVKQIRARKKILLLGNHDKKKDYKGLFDEIYDGPLLIAEKILLSHEPVYGLPWCLNIHGHDHSNIEFYKDGCKHLNLAANVCGNIPVSLGKLIKEGILSDITSIHRITIDRATEKKRISMASIVERRGRFCVVYSYKDKNGKRRQKWETYKTMSEAKKRKKEIEYRADIGQMIVPHCKTVKELLEEYVNLYGKEAWALSTYSSNVSMINNYIIPIIGGDKLENINTRFIEKYYQRLLRTPAVINPTTGKRQSEYVTPATIRDIHKLLRNCFQQAVKWELMAKNPVIYATVPKYKSAKREIWTAETLMHALEVCEDDRLKLALNLAFSCSLRMGEMLGLTWDCVDISEEAIAESRAYIYVDKEVQRVDKAAIQELRGKDVILVFLEESKKNKTVRVLKLPKTESSIRKVFLPKSVAEMLVEWKKGQDKIKETLGDEYMDYNLVMATPFGLPIGTSSIRKALNDLIREHDLPPVVFHSLRHTSVTYKLKLNGGDIKAVQGDSGHSQINMVTDVYSHIIDDDRRKNAELFEQAFYEKKNLDPSMHANVAGKTVELPTNVDAELLAKVLSNPEMAALLSTLVKSLESK